MSVIQSTPNTRFAEDAFGILYDLSGPLCPSVVVDELKDYGGISVHEFRVIPFLINDVAGQIFVR